MDTSECLGRIPGVDQVERKDCSWWIAAPALDVLAMARVMNESEGRLVAITAIPLDEEGETVVLYHYVDREQHCVNFRTLTRDGRLPSIATLARPAGWAEREIKDLFAVDFTGHPNLIPLLRPAGLAEGAFRVPMCAAARASTHPRSPS